jgi:hypothetical protein
MIIYRYAVTLTLQAPVLSQAAGGRTLGIDAAALSDEGQPALPGSLIRGNLRHAWEYFEKAFQRSHASSAFDITKWLGPNADQVRWYDLSLISVGATNDLVDKGRNVVIVALVGTDLHIRIFDASAKKVFDKAENELVSGDMLTALKERLIRLRDESSLSQKDQQEIIRTAALIAGHAQTRRSDTYEPKRARLQFAAYWLARGDAASGQRHRIAIEPGTGTVKRRHLQTIEMPFAPGAAVKYEGYIDVLSSDEKEADRVARWIRKALEFTPALGAFKGVGFGRILAVEIGRGLRKTPPTAGTTTFPARFGIRLAVDRPFCFAKPHPSETNRYESEDFIPGGAILGAMARQLFPDGRDKYPDDRWKLLREQFHRVRVTHAVPSERGGKRSVALPLSLVFDPEAKKPQLYDLALKRGPLLVNGHAPIFRIDWKAKHWAEASSVYARSHDPERVIIVRTAINPTTGAAKENQLFAVEAVRPERHEWLAEIDVDLVTSDRETVAAKLSEILQQGLSMLGKTKAMAAVEVLATPVIPAFGSNPKLKTLRLTTGEDAKIAIVTLQSAARLLPRLRDIPATNGDEALAAAYRQAWRTLSFEHMELLWYYAEERLVGGIYLWHRFGGEKDPYNPEVLTVPGSVFVLKLVGDEAKAEARLTELLAHGLPQLPGAPGGEDWKLTPYIRNNGYGEVAINLDLHWSRNPPEGICEELPDD